MVLLNETLVKDIRELELRKQQNWRIPWVEPGGKPWEHVIFQFDSRINIHKFFYRHFLRFCEIRIESKWTSHHIFPCCMMLYQTNRPFPSSLVSLFQSEFKCETILMKMTSISMKEKLHAELIFIQKVSHLDSF